MEASADVMDGDGAAGNWTDGNWIDGEWADGEWEYQPMRLPPEVSRLTASVRLAIQAEYGGWELSRVRLYPGGERKVLLRRRRTRHRLPELHT